MPSVSQLILARHRRRRVDKRSILIRLGQISIAILATLGVIISVLIIFTSSLYADLLDDLPSHEALLPIFDSQSAGRFSPTELFDRTGQHVIATLENPNARGQKYLFYEAENRTNLPDDLILATISSIEPNFWNNPGLSWKSLQDKNQPTIALKLVRQFILDDESRTDQLLQEWLLAAQLINLYGHEQILEWYLNSEYYGNLAFGADAAARVYFGKSAAEINLAEAAVIAAAAQSPTNNPIDNPIALEKSKTQILTGMYNQGTITEEQLTLALAQEIPIQSQKEFPVNQAPVFTDLVIQQVSQFIPEEQIFRGGLEIITSMDYELQYQVDCTVDYQLRRISGEISARLTSNEFDDCDMARLLPSNYEQETDQELSIAANALIMDPKESQVLAIADSRSEDMRQDAFTNHSPGTILSPIIYLTSFTRGSSPASLLWDIPDNLPSGIVEIANEIDQFQGPVNLRTALANDYLTPALQVLTQMEPEQVWQTAARMGLTKLQVPPGDDAYRLLFQGGDVNLIELSQVYAVLANQGVLSGIPKNTNGADLSNTLFDPQVVLKVINNSDQILLDCTDQLSECQPSKRPVLSHELAYLITDVLSDEAARWPSLGHPNSLEIGRPAAAKIGSTLNKESVWTLGYTPELLAGVWVGSEESSINSKISIEWAADLWHAVLQYATKDYPSLDFPIPPNINEIAVCNPSGLLPSNDCPQVVDEIFISGNEPTQVDNLYRTFPVNKETRNLATIYTSPALIEDQIFLVYPPEANEWARDAGIPQIPKDYDIIDFQFNGDNNINISSPSMFSTIQGSVSVMGTAAGEEFVSYRLQAGSGLNPDTWYQIGEAVNEPVRNGKLGTWNTSELNGLHVLQLLVSYEDGRVSSTIVQVTVDNQNPEVLIRYPQDGQTINQSEANSITIQAEVSDNLGIDEVEVYIDGNLHASLTSPPFAVPWRTLSGEHIIRVSANDLAGNTSNSRVRIIVE